MCTSLLSTPKASPVVVPEAQPAPAAVQEGDAGVATAREDLRKRRLAASGANNTLVTGGQGLVSQANTGGGQLFGQ